MDEADGQNGVHGRVHQAGAPEPCLQVRPSPVVRLPLGPAHTVHARAVRACQVATVLLVPAVIELWFARLGLLCDLLVLGVTLSLVTLVVNLFEVLDAINE